MGIKGLWDILSLAVYYYILGLKEEYLRSRR